MNNPADINQIVIIGGGHAAGQFADSIRKAGYQGKLVMICQEPEVPYQRPPLSKKYLAGELPKERLMFRPKPMLEKLDIDFRLGVTATGIDKTQQQVSLSTGETIAYDKLVLATGASPRKVKTDHPKGVHYLRTLADVDAIRAEVADAKNISVVGGGYIGLEVAAILSQNHQVTVLEAQQQVMDRVASPQIADFFAEQHRTHGVTIKTGAMVQSFTEENGKLTGLNLANGETVTSDLAIIGIGVIPETGLAESAGLNCEDGIVVDENTQTEDPNIFAIGDCTRHPNNLIGQTIRLESVHNAMEQAKTAALAIMGQPKPYHQIPWFWSDQYQFKLQMAGISHGHDQAVVRGDLQDQAFSVFYFREGQLIAADSINQPKEHLNARKLLNGKVTVSSEQVADIETDLSTIS